MQILTEKEIKQKIKRLAIEILENNFGEKEIILAGINNNGTNFAKMLGRTLKRMTDTTITYTRIRLNPAAPIRDDINIEMPEKDLKNKVIIIIDDVANTGRTIFYAFKPLMSILVKKIEVAVLVDRKHKSFPVKVDYLGLSLATTVGENIDVHLKGVEEKAVFLN